MQIAIDGPVAAGKGTIAKLLAQRLNWLYVDTGAMYRAAAWLGLEKNLPLDSENEAALADLVTQSDIKMDLNPEDSIGHASAKIWVNGLDLSETIREPRISIGASQVARLPLIREVLVEKQQQLASNRDVVMEGRDITYRVLPNADLKIYLTAQPEERAQRRFLQLQANGQTNVTLEQVQQDLVERDETDTHRQADPLRIVPDAWVLDTTGIPIPGVVDLIIERWQKIKS